MTAATLEDYRTAIRELSDAIVAAQAPIRILNSVKWDDDVRERFFADRFRRQPMVDTAYYDAHPHGCNSEALADQLRDIERAIGTRLGTTAAVSLLLRRICEQYRLSLELLDARGTDAFGVRSNQLYGTPDDVFHAGGPTVADLAAQFRDALHWVSAIDLDERDEPNIAGTEAVVELQRRLDDGFGEGLVNVVLDDGIIADAAAGSDYIKLRADAWFSERQIDQLEIHEGWVHVATSLNGRTQPVCTFLGKTPPSGIVTQEGLATLAEIVTMRSHPERLLRIADRIDAIRMAGDGATFLDVFEQQRVNGLDEQEAWQVTVRTFRGSTPTGAPFTKDLAYGKGLVSTYAYIRVAVREGRLDRIPMLFCGKVDLEVIGTIGALYDEGLIDPPRFIPPPFADPYGLVAQIAFSRFLRDLDFDRLHSDYAKHL